MTGRPLDRRKLGSLRHSAVNPLKHAGRASLGVVPGMLPRTRALGMRTQSALLVRLSRRRHEHHELGHDGQHVASTT